MAPKEKGGKQPKPSSPIKTGYLILYNTVSAVAWSIVLARTISIATTHGPRFVVAGAGEWTKWTQTAAVLEILHSLLGICPLSFPPPTGRARLTVQP